jgi:hypothetical protein
LRRAREGEQLVAGFLEAVTDNGAFAAPLAQERFAPRLDFLAA